MDTARSVYAISQVFLFSSEQIFCALRDSQPRSDIVANKHRRTPSDTNKCTFLLYVSKGLAMSPKKKGNSQSLSARMKGSEHYLYLLGPWLRNTSHVGGLAHVSFVLVAFNIRPHSPRTALKFWWSLTFSETAHCVPFNPACVFIIRSSIPV